MEQRYNVYWGNSEDGYHLCYEDVTRTEASALIFKWRAENAPALHLDGAGYWRGHLTKDNIEHLDYGSHYNFFQLRPI